MDDLFFWFVARATGLTAFAAISLSVVSGEALRTSVLDFLASNRAIRKLHDFTTWLWIPLAIAHVVTLILDKTARIALRDAVIPFQVGYGWWQIGLGTLALDILVVVTVTSWLRKYMNNTLWQWIHRTSYIAFAAIFACNAGLRYCTAATSTPSRTLSVSRPSAARSVHASRQFRSGVPPGPPKK